jgi:hypothetical protein
MGRTSSAKDVGMVLRFLLTGAWMMAVAAEICAGDPCCCAHCGACCACQKVCRLVCDAKKVEVVCWGVACEDFCLPKPSEPGCRHSRIVCADCDASCDREPPVAAPKRFVWRDWIPTCAKLFTKKKLMKKTETVTVPSFKWVVEDLCTDCRLTCDVASVDAATETQLPPPPLADARLLYLRK